MNKWKAKTSQPTVKQQWYLRIFSLERKNNQLFGRTHLQYPSYWKGTVDMNEKESIMITCNLIETGLLSLTLQFAKDRITQLMGSWEMKEQHFSAFFSGDSCDGSMEGVVNTATGIIEGEFSFQGIFIEIIKYDLWFGNFLLEKQQTPVFNVNQ